MDFQREASDLEYTQQEDALPNTEPRTSSDSSSDDESLAHPRGHIRQLPMAKLEADDSNEHRVSHFALDEEKLIEIMGVSGLCIISKSKGLYERFTLLSAAAQAFTLQYIILWNMAKYIQEATHSSAADAAGPVQKSFVVVAIYLHFMNLMADIPCGLAIMSHFFHLHHSWNEVLISMPIFVIDSLVTPLVTTILGSLFLCTSKTAADVLLNSCALAFISVIDNGILSTSGTMKNMAKYRSHPTVYVPYQPKIIKCIDSFFVTVPVLPLLFAVGMAYIGMDVEKLYLPPDE